MGGEFTELLQLGHFIDGKIETQRIKSSCSRTQAEVGPGQAWDQWLLTLILVLIPLCCKMWAFWKKTYDILRPEAPSHTICPVTLFHCGETEGQQKKRFVMITQLSQDESPNSPSSNLSTAAWSLRVRPREWMALWCWRVWPLEPFLWLLYIAKLRLWKNLFSMGKRSQVLH